MYKFHRSKKKTFTLIEMLIVIVIIGILATALVPRLTSIQGRARDTKRKVDLKTIYNSLALYFLDNSVYLTPWTGSINSSDKVYSVNQWGWMTGLWNYMTSAPVDPINNDTKPWRIDRWYSYVYHNVYSSPSNTYDLTTKLENSQDPDRCELKDYLFQFSSTWQTSWCIGTFSGTYSPLIYEYSPDSNSF